MAWGFCCSWEASVLQRRRTCLSVVSTWCRLASQRKNRVPATGRLTRNLKRDVEAIAFPEGRMVGAEGHEKARCYLLRWLGIAKLEDRSHITALASRLMRMGL